MNKNGFVAESPSPLEGEGGDGGAVFTPTLTLPRRGGGNWTPLAAAVVIASLAGCATMAAPTLPEQSMPAAWKHTDAATPAAEASWPDASWWNNFGSPELVDLIKSAEQNNHDLAA